MTGYTIYSTYEFLDGVYGYSNAVHCNYINKLIVPDLGSNDVNIYFNSVDDFRFLADYTNTAGTGYTATKMNVLLQVVNNSTFTDPTKIQPSYDKWRIYDVTAQIVGHTVGTKITASQLLATIFKLPLSEYNSKPIYNIDYLNYPKAGLLNSTLAFGEEILFLGNVSTGIEAIAESMEIDILLPAGQYNTTTNKTWDGISKVYISEVGIYNANNELVAIGKLNTPVSKDSTIARTLVFGIDF